MVPRSPLLDRDPGAAHDAEPSVRDSGPVRRAVGNGAVARLLASAQQPSVHAGLSGRTGDGIGNGVLERLLSNGATPPREVASMAAMLTGHGPAGSDGVLGLEQGLETDEGERVEEHENLEASATPSVAGADAMQEAPVAGAPPAGGVGGAATDQAGPPGPPAARTITVPGPVDGPSSGPPPRMPEQAPGFRAVAEQVRAVAEAQRTHQPAIAASRSAQAAAPPPTNEIAAGAAAVQVDDMGRQEPRPFDAEAFRSRLARRIEAVAPENPKEARKFAKSGQLDALAGELDAEVDRTVDHARGDLKEVTATPPDPSTIEPKPVTPLHTEAPGPPPPPVAAAAAVPGPRTDTEICAPIEAGEGNIDQLMAQEDVTDDQLARSGEPTFVAACLARSQAATHAQQVLPTVRDDEQDLRDAAVEDVQLHTSQALAAMHGGRAEQLSKVAASQSETMARDRDERATVAAAIESIYERTASSVEQRLQRLDDDVDSAFTAGAETARKTFEDHVDAGLRERYKGVRGKARWGKDKLLTWGVPSAVARIFERGRQRYLDAMDTALDRVAEIVETGLGEATSIVADGRQRIADYVQALPQSLQAVGQDAASAIATRFDALEQSVIAKQDELVDSLAQRYQEQLNEVDTRIEELHAEHRGLVGKAFDKIGGVVATIRGLKNLLLDVLASAREAVGHIIRDPIAFLGKLITGVKQGLQQFVDNIRTHLKSALVGWLFGALKDAGLRLPKSLDPPAVLGLVMQILDLSYAAVRSRAAKIVGEGVVTRLEQFAEPFLVFAREGPGGLWGWIGEKLTSLKDTVVGQIQDFVVTRVVRAGVTWLVSLLNPAAAFIKACKAIYNIVTFFIERGKQVAALVTAIVGSVSAIAKDAVGSAAGFIEKTLGKALPVVLSFLASLLGLGGISTKIRSIIETVRAPVGTAVDWLIERSVGMVRAAGRLAGLGPEQAQQPQDLDGSTGDPEHDLAVATGLAAIDELEQPYLQNGEIARDDAESVAARVEHDHPVFTSISVIDGGTHWEYQWTGSKGRHRTRARKDKSPSPGEGFLTIKHASFQLPAALRFGEEFEKDVAPYVHGELRAEIESGGRRAMVLQGQKTLRQWPQTRRPDWIAEARTPARRLLREVHVIEATLVTDWRAETKTGRADKYAWHKRVQVPSTAMIALEKYPNVKIVYHIIAPAEPSVRTKDEIEQSLREITGASGRLEVVWRIVGG